MRKLKTLNKGDKMLFKKVKQLLLLSLKDNATRYAIGAIIHFLLMFIVIAYYLFFIS